MVLAGRTQLLKNLTRQVQSHTPLWVKAFRCPDNGGMDAAHRVEFREPNEIAKQK
jgi:hypothetical protein